MEAADILRYLNGYDPWLNPGPYVYRQDEADRATGFIETCLYHTKGKWEGRPFRLHHWERAVVETLFGWVHSGTAGRRYGTVFVYVPRKNGKSELVAAIAAFLLFCDGEPSAEIYIGAKNRIQAATMWNMARKCIRPGVTSGVLAEEVYVSKATTSIHLRDADGDGAFVGDSKIQAVPHDADALHSLSPSVTIIDELHAQPDGRLIEALTSGMGARRDPLTVYVTTADNVGPSVCNEELEIARAVRAGLNNDPRYLPVIYEAATDADWRSPDVWAAVNPSYPEHPTPEFLAGECAKCVTSQRRLGTFKRLYLNIQTAVSEAWINADHWAACADRTGPPDLTGQKCYIAVDLASKLDMCAMVGYFPESGWIVPRFFVTEASVIADESGQYAQWLQAGLIETAGDERIDDAYIQEVALHWRGKYDVRKLAFDPYNANSFVNGLQRSDDDIECVEFRQGPKSYTEPCLEFEARLAARKLRHNHAVLDWMAGHVEVKRTDDPVSLRPVKPPNNNRLKIDGIVAAVMAIGLDIADVDDGTGDISAILATGIIAG